VLLNAAATFTMAAGIALSPALHQAVPLDGVFAAGLPGCCFTIGLAGPALAVSAAGRRAQVVGAAIAFGSVGYALNFAALAWSKAAPLRFLSPFHHYTPGEALAHGTLAWGSSGVLPAVGAAGLAIALPLPSRRDLAP
jgi:ABC-2 type transport system permease protein